MAWYHEVRSAVQSLFTRRSMEREMEEEMQFHLEMEARRNQQAGMAPDEARRRAGRDFGGVSRAQEEVRDERGARWLEDLAQDVRYALRTMGRRLGFTSVAVITLALGIGATTALFSVVKAVLLTRLPYGNPEGVAVIWSAWKGFPQTWLSYDEFEAYDSVVPAFDNVALFADGSANLGGDDGEPERIRTSLVTEDIFSILGVSPIHGRGFTKEEDTPNGPSVIILGYPLWQRRYGADPAIVGKQIQVSGQATTVVGVMPDGFKLPLDFGANGPSEAWQPMQTDAAQNGATPGPTFTAGGSSHGFYGVARLAKAATIEQANRQLTDLIAQAKADGIYPEEMQFRAYAVPVEEQVTGRIRPALLVTFGAVGFVLLIACANVAGLMLVRGEARRRELAVRVALGAGTRRLTRQLLTESVVLGSLGGVLGVALAALGVWAVRHNAPPDLPRFTEARLDPVVLIFAVAIAMLAALLSGVLPALQANGIAPANELKEGGRGATVGGARLRWRQALVAAEIALAVVLVTGAGLMVKSVSNLFAINAGLDPRNVLTMRLSTPSTYYADSVTIENFYDELQRRVAALPGVTSVGAVRILPLATQAGDWGLEVEGYTPPANHGTPGDWQVVTAGYFETMGMKAVQGRLFDARDKLGAPLAMIVNRRFVELYFGGRDPLGRRVRIMGSPDSVFYTVVGVVENVHHNGLTTEVKGQFYAPLGQFALAPGNTSRSMNLVVKTAGDPKALIRPVRQTIRELDNRLPVSGIRTMENVLAGSIAEPRFAMGLLTLFGILALVLSAIGIFGIVAQVVAARAHEFGIRIALGATPRHLVGLSLKTGVAQTAVGLAVGIVAALLLTRALTGLLHGVTPTDVSTFLTVIAVTGVVSLLASVGPARKAVKTDPMTVLHEG
ncbi:MAG TPA: ABC transporter permease [Gemmatimonadaceae bacterium]|nr:ABC transporter permease [Gemmatimonadaceae bacterium]